MAQFCKVETDKTKTKHTAGDQECADIITHTPHSLILLLFLLHSTNRQYVPIYFETFNYLSYGLQSLKQKTLYYSQAIYITKEEEYQSIMPVN
jgi:hypothetical protein